MVLVGSRPPTGYRRASMANARSAVPFGAGLAAGLAISRLLTSPPGPLRAHERLSIAAPDAAGWVTDFLNAAYYRAPGRTSATSTTCGWPSPIVTTLWRRAGRRRLRGTTWCRSTAPSAARGSTAGARVAARSTARSCSPAPRELLGDWFPDAYADDARRGWGIAFETRRGEGAHDPSGGSRSRGWAR